MRKLASIQRITDIKEIIGATAIEVATVLGWHVVVKKGEFKVGELCFYFETDSLLPLIPEFSFLEKSGSKKKMLVEGKEVEGYRLRTIKLRGQISQGLCLPLTDFIMAFKKAGVYKEGILKEGMDVTKDFGVYKYEPPMPANLSGQAKGFLPGYIPKTDETRIQAFPEILTRYQGVKFYVTEKVDGSSATLFIDKVNEFNVTSRTMNWKEDSGNSFWKVARELKVEEKLKKHPTIALQGELIGEGIQSNRLKIKGQTILFYNAYDFEKGKYLDFPQFRMLIQELELPMVPLVRGYYMLPKTVDEIVKFATRRSLLLPESWAEGIVFRPLTEMQDVDLGRLSFKVVNPEYLLKYEQ